MIRIARRLTKLFGLNALAIASFLLLTLSPIAWLGFIISGATLATAWWRYRKSGLGKGVSVRILVIGGVVATYVPSLRDTNDYWLLVTTALLTMLIMHEGLVRRVVSGAGLTIRNMPGFTTRTKPHVDPNAIFHANTAMIVLLGLFAVPAFPSWPLTLVTGALTLGTAALLLDARQIRRTNERTWLRFREALEEHAPAFAVYFSGPPGVLYQIAMWMPYFERLGKPYIVVLREGHAAGPVSEMTTAPVVVCSSISSLDNVAVEGMHAAFYVNNGMKNSHFVKFRHITHIQLLHGDSDKPPSYNPVTGMYDRIFVAGQAGIDRYHKHGVDIAETKFDVVGRPQVESIEVTTRHIADVAKKTVLYAPTWRGYSEDANYCSLPVAKKLVQKLIARDATVILRGHPFTDKDPNSARQLAEVERMLAADRRENGRPHVFGAAASQEMSIVDCFNAADVLISDVSSVVSDFLFSEKPFAITDMVDEREEFIESFPLAHAAYVFRKDLSNADEALDELLKTDSLERTRQEARAYYLGDFPAETYVDAFVEGASRYI